MASAVEPERDAAQAQTVRDAARILAAGGLVAFPTETVYGLGARADDDAAVAAIFALKGRPTDHPLIVHVTGSRQADWFAQAIPPVGRRLIAAFWPGPLTLIVPRAPGRAAVAAGGHASIGLRCPAHPLARALLAAAAELGVPGVAAPSANRFGSISPTTAQHVRDEFGGHLRVLDGGPCGVGIESAIVDCTQEHLVLLRPGALTRAEIEAAAGAPLCRGDATSARAPGTLEAHYAPRARLRLLGSAALRSELGSLKVPAGAVAVYSRCVPAAFGLPVVPACAWHVMPGAAAAAAHELFATLRDLDQSGPTEIWVEEPPDTPEWEGVRDRLQRAAAT